MSFVNIDAKKILKDKFKKGGNEKKEKKEDELEIITENFITFLEKSASRECECKDAEPILTIETLRNGKKRKKLSCSVCKGKFYKERDFAFIAQVHGMKGSGKTTLALALADVIRQIDKYRRIAIWQCPDALIDALHDVMWCKKYETTCQRAIGEDRWSNKTPQYMIKKEKREVHASFQKKEIKYRICDCSSFKTSTDCKKCPNFKDGLKEFVKIDKLKDVKWNDVLIVDETIISMSGKEALTKGMVKWGKFLGVLRHKRVIMFALFQRPDIIKTLRDLTDMRIYKRISDTEIEEEKKDKFMKAHSKSITSLDKTEAYISSNYFHFSKRGLIITKVPEWYNEEISMSYESETDFVDDDSEEENLLKKAKEMAKWLRDKNIIIENASDKLGAKGLLRDAFIGVKANLVTMAIEQYFAMEMNNFEEREIKNDELKEEDNAWILNSTSNISQVDREVFQLFVNGRSVTKFEEDYHKNKEEVSRTVRRVGKWILNELNRKIENDIQIKRGAEDAERIIKKISWDKGGVSMRAVGSGGERGNIPAPDLIEVTTDGRIRPIQVKERNFKNEVVIQPTSMNNELKISNRIKTIAYNNRMNCPKCNCIIEGRDVGGFLKPDNAYLYVMKKGDKETILKESIKTIDNKKSLRIDWDRKMVIRQEPDLKQITNPELKDFLKSNDVFFNKNEIENEDDNEINKNLSDEELDSLINIDELIEEDEKIEEEI